MKRIFLALVFFLSSIAAPQDSVMVNIFVIADTLADSSKIYVSGNNSKLGMWNPGKIMLDRFDDSTWTGNFIFLKGEIIEFKFTLGNWDSEALDDKGRIPSNYRLELANDTSLYFYIEKWKGQSSIVLDGKITGNVDYIRNLTYLGLEPRDVIVWLPPSYDSLIDKSYPVLYMHDGQNLFDPKTSAFQLDWQIDETVDSLIRAGDIEEVIVVGIYNTFNRYSEYSPNDTGYLYMKFIVDELKPLIDRTYRTKPEREYTATAGSSMGGLISFMLAWEHSETFSKAACLSPAFLYRDFNYVKKVSEYTGNKKSIIIYIDNGGVDIEKILQPGIDKMLTEMVSKGFEMGDDLIWYKDNDAVHSESAWAKRAWRFLKLFFGLL